MAEQRAVAQNANFFFDCYFGRGTGDSVVFTGDGVDDIDRVIAVIANGTSYDARFQVDVGSMMGGQGMGYFGTYRPFDLEDLQAIRQFYVGWYGESAKPDAYAPSR